MEKELSHQAECAKLAEQGLQAARAGAEARERELRRELGKAGEAQQALRAERARLDKELGERGAALAGAQERAESLRDEVAAGREEAAGLRVEAATARANLERRAQECRAAVDAAEGKLRDAERERDSLRQQLQDAESRALAQERAHDHAISELQRARDEDRHTFNQELVPLRHEAAAHRAECGRLKLDLEEAREYRALAERAGEEAGRERVAKAQAQTELWAKAEALEGLAQGLQAEEAAKLGLLEELREQRAQWDALAGELEGARARSAKLHEERDALEDTLRHSKYSAESALKKCALYRRENRVLLQKYDGWLKGIVEQHTGPLSGSPSFVAGADLDAVAGALETPI